MQTSAHWLEEMPPNDSLDIYRELAYSHALQGGEQGRVIGDLISRNKIRDLCEYDLPLEPFHEGLEHVRSAQDCSREEFALIARSAAKLYHCRQALAFFKKLEPLDVGIDKEGAALLKFIEAELQCKVTNDLFVARRAGMFQFTSRVEQALVRARRMIRFAIGDCPPQLGDLVAMRFGPGATRATKKREASIRRKLAERLQCSEELFPAVRQLLEELPHLVDIHSIVDRTDEDGQEWGVVDVQIMDGRLTFAVKDAKTYRTVTTEAGLNVIVQSGYGDTLRDGLLRVGVDIRDQTLNQRRAKSGSLTGEEATLDQKSASDTNATELCAELLPLDWFVALNRARTKKVLLPSGLTLVQEKFSSMGNGFTFPLETLIFWSLASAVCPPDTVSVYGDDIVVPTDRYRDVVEVLTAVGFWVNEKKSFHTGLFRESCGKDYFGGIDVRPYHAKSWVSAQSLFVLHNFYVRRGDEDRARWVLSKIHPSLRIFGPDGYGDGHLLGIYSKKRKPKYDSRGWSGYFFDTFVTRTSRDEISLERGEHVVPLYSIYRRSPGEFPAFTGGGTFNAYWSRLERHAREGVGGSVFAASGSAPLPLATSGSGVKELPLPEVVGYKKITIYTLGD